MIPFSPPLIDRSDIDAVVDVLRSGWITTGPAAHDFEAALTEYCGTARTVVLSSATAALELALRLIGVGPGDEVIVPSYTYTASASVIAHVGATIVMVDVQEGHPFPSIDTISSAVTDRTKAIITVDLAGIPFDSRPLRRALAGRGNVSSGLAERLHRPVIISDSAHSLGARLDGLHAGGIADLTAFSFHAVKNLTTGEGGALTWRRGLPTDDDEFEARIRRLSLHGQTKDALSKQMGSSWEYDVVSPAYKFNMPDILAAIGRSQLTRYDSMLERREELFARYRENLRGTGVSLLDHEVSGGRSSLHLAIASVPSASVEERNRIIDEMYASGVSANVHYKPLPLLTAYADLGFEIADHPNSMGFYSTEITLPLHLSLTLEDVDAVCAALVDASGATADRA